MPSTTRQPNWIKSPHTYAQAGELATSTGDFDRAVRYFQAGRNAAPEDIALLLGQGGMFFRWKKYDDAIAVFEKALRSKRPTSLLQSGGLAM